MPAEIRQEKLRGDFGRWLLEQPAKHVAPFWWVEPKPTSDWLILPSHPCPRNGSMFFANIDEHLFGITAAHVYRGFLKAKERYPGLVCRLGEGTFALEPETRLCSIGGLEKGVDRVDVATFHLTRDDLKAINKEALVADADSWPPPHPFTGQQAKLLGYPRVSRLWISEAEISFGLYAGGPLVASASDAQITFNFERENWVDSLGHGLPPQGMDLGGMSGGPVLFAHEANRDWSLSIGGVISEMHSSPHYETVVAVPAHFIGADGKVLDERSAPTKFYLRP